MPLELTSGIFLLLFAVNNIYKYILTFRNSLTLPSLGDKIILNNYVRQTLWARH
jgi:hypothetical protein